MFTYYCIYDIESLSPPQIWLVKLGCWILFVFLSYSWWLQRRMEQSGFYDGSTGYFIPWTEQMPLMSAHWCLKTPSKLRAVAGNDWLIWDITRSRYFLSIFIYYVPKNQSLLLNDPLTYSCIPGPHCKAKLRLSYKRARVNGLLHNRYGFTGFTLRVTERIM